MHTDRLVCDSACTQWQVFRFQPTNQYPYTQGRYVFITALNRLRVGPMTSQQAEHQARFEYISRSVLTVRCWDSAACEEGSFVSTMRVRTLTVLKM